MNTAQEAFGLARDHFPENERRTVAAVPGECKRPSCVASVPPQAFRRGEPRVYCSDSCRRKHWEEQHPRVKAADPEQPRLDFTPAASQLAHAVRGRETKAQRILARLKEGPATSIELARITHRFSARILELRRTHKISREDHVHGGQEWSTYTLEGE